MTKVYAQGDVLLIATSNNVELPPDRAVKPLEDGAVVLAEGEHAGHRHAFYGGAVLFRDDALAREIPRDLYIGHVKVAAAGATLEHGERQGQQGDHDPVKIPAGTYIAMRQTEYPARERRRTVAD